MSGKPLAIIVSPGNTYTSYVTMAIMLNADMAKWQGQGEKIPKLNEVVEIVNQLDYFQPIQRVTMTLYLVESIKDKIQYVVNKKAFEFLEGQEKNLKYIAITNKMKEISARRKSLGYVW